MDEFLRGSRDLASLLAGLGVSLEEIPEELVGALSQPDMSEAFIWAWCQAAETFGRTRRLTPALCALLARDDHEGHEDLAESLQNLRDPGAVDCLFDRATRPLDYLIYNDSVALARKCVWALHDIGTPEAMARLADLTHDPRREVAEAAARRLAARPTEGVPDYRASRDSLLGPL